MSFAASDFILKMNIGSSGQGRTEGPFSGAAGKARSIMEQPWG